MPKDSGKISLRLTRQKLYGFSAALCLLSVIDLFCAPISAQDTTAAPANLVAPQPSQLRSTPLTLAKALEKRGDLSLQDATIEKALFAIGASWNVNIVVGKDVKGTVSCIYKQAPLKEVLDAILLANGYSYRAVGQSLVVQQEKEVGVANPLFESAAISVTHADLQEVIDGAQLLKSQKGQIRGLDSARSFLVIDYADRVEAIRAFVAQMNAASAQASGGAPTAALQQLQVSYFHTQFVPVESVREPLSAVLSQAGRIATMQEENRLVVVDYASNIAMVRRVLERIDRPVPQVRITALIYDVSLQDVEQLGLNWNSAANGNNLDADGNPQQTLAFDSTTLVPFLAGTPGGTATIRSLTRNFDITTIASLLQNANDARLLANPSVTVSENQTANMRSVQQIPFQQITQSELGGTLGTTQFKDVGVTLDVTPTVAADGTIKLVVDQEFSVVAGFTDDTQPIIDTRASSTIVRIANQRTLVIGGLRQRSDTGDFNGIPFLKDVKLIGPLFRSRSTTVRESELIVFLMPEIVGYDAAPSQREFLAEETVRSRLDQVPKAEGWQAPYTHRFNPNFPTQYINQSQINQGAAKPNQQKSAIGPVQYTAPLNEPIPSVAPAANSTPVSVAQNPLVQHAPIRQEFGDRFRSTTGKEKTRQANQEQSPQKQSPKTTSSVKEDSRALLNLIRASR